MSNKNLEYAVQLTIATLNACKVNYVDSPESVSKLLKNNYNTLQELNPQSSNSCGWSK